MLNTRLDLNNFNIFYSHRYLSFLEHDYALKLDNYFSILSYFNNSKRNGKDEEPSMAGYSLSTAKEELEILEKNIKMIKNKLEKVEPYIYELKPIYVASSYTTIATYLLFDKKRYKQIISFLKERRIKYIDNYKNNIDNAEYIIIKFFDFGYANNAEDLKYLKLSNIESIDIKINDI